MYYKWLIGNDLFCARVLGHYANYYKNGNVYALYQKFIKRDSDVEISENEFYNIINLQTIKNKNKMPKQPSPTSVSTVVSNLEVDGSASFENSYASVAVMVSVLRKKEQHKEKKFKIQSKENITTVTRVK